MTDVWQGWRRIGNGETRGEIKWLVENGEQAPMPSRFDPMRGIKPVMLNTEGQMGWRMWVG